MIIVLTLPRSKPPVTLIEWSKDRLFQSIALAANCVTILGLLLVILQLRQNRSLRLF